MEIKARDAIAQLGEPVLRQEAAIVTKSQIESRELNKLIEKMRVLLAQEEYGVGLAAPQAGVPLRLFIVAGRVFEEESDEDKKETKSKKKTTEPHPGDRVFINPVIIRTSRGKKEMSEGCLSIPGKYGMVPRHEKASLRALDEHGKTFTYHGTGLLAHIFQHEVDHLNGILFIDKASKFDKEKKRAGAEAVKA